MKVWHWGIGYWALESKSEKLSVNSDQCVGRQEVKNER